MSERPSAERLAEIRYSATRGFPCTRSMLERIARELLAELDAVTRERDEARTVTDAMVDRAYRAWGAYQSTKVDASGYGAMRAALTAAMAKDGE